jgi:hypothetical protein
MTAVKDPAVTRVQTPDTKGLAATGQSLLFPTGNSEEVGGNSAQPCNHGRERKKERGRLVLLQESRKM